jgi:hypothetical protein
MKVKLIFVQIILFGFVLQPVFGQKGCNCLYTDKAKYEAHLSGELFLPAIPVPVTTYYNNNWLLGDIYLSDGEIIRNEKIRYNGLLDELFWIESKSNKVIKIDKEEISQFHFLNFQGDTSVYYRKIKIKRDIAVDSTEIFAQELFKGKLSLYVQHTFFIERKEMVGALQKDIYKEELIYFLSLMNNKTVGFKKLNLKNLNAFLPEKEDQIKQYFKENKQTKFKDNTELINLVKFINLTINH